MGRWGWGLQTSPAGLRSVGKKMPDHHHHGHTSAVKDDALLVIDRGTCTDQQPSSMLHYVHRDRSDCYGRGPKTATSTFTHLLSSDKLTTDEKRPSSLIEELAHPQLSSRGTCPLPHPPPPGCQVEELAPAPPPPSPISCQVEELDP